MSKDQLILIGDIHESIPVLLIQDPDLSSNDKVVWQVLRVSVQLSQEGVLMPAQADIARTMNITKKTVITSITALRITRWLSVQRQYDDVGRQLRNIYAIHARPANFEDACDIDRDYISLLEKSTIDDQVRIQALARQALSDLGTYPSMTHSRLQADHAEYTDSVNQYVREQFELEATPLFGRTPIRFGEPDVENVDFSTENVENTRGVKITPLVNTSSVKNTPPENARGVKNTPLINTGSVNNTPHADTGGVIFTPPSSSNIKNTTTTNTNTNTNNEKIKFEDNNDILKLTDQERLTLFSHLERLPYEDRQVMWDEFTEVVMKKRKSGTAILNPVTYFMAMITRYHKGEFNFTGAFKRMDERRKILRLNLAALETADTNFNRSIQESEIGNQGAISPKLKNLMSKVKVGDQ